MKAYVDLDKGFAFGSGKAHEFKSQSRQRLTGKHSVVGETINPKRLSPLSSWDSPYSRRHSSSLNSPDINAAENTPPLSSILKECRVAYLG